MLFAFTNIYVLFVIDLCQICLHILNQISTLVKSIFLLDMINYAIDLLSFIL